MTGADDAARQVAEIRRIAGLDSVDLAAMRKTATDEGSIAFEIAIDAEIEMLIAPRLHGGSGGSAAGETRKP